MSLAAVWLIVGIALIVSEFVVPGFVIIFFGIGAFLAAAIAAFTEVSLLVQGYVFVIASLAILALGRRYCKALLCGKRELAKQDADDSGIIGAVVTVTQAIEPPSPGRVALHGSEWKAISDRPLAKGATAKVKQLDNITLIVE